MGVLVRARSASGDPVTSFELICLQPLASAIQFIEGVRDHLAKVYDEYALVEFSGAQPVAFGHCGDGNIHYNNAQPIGSDKQTFLEQSDSVTKTVYDIIVDLGGSFSAEHGVGQLKLAEMARYKDQLELNLMRKLKNALDPKGIMNPGKIL